MSLLVLLSDIAKIMSQFLSSFFHLCDVLKYID